MPYYIDEIGIGLDKKRMAYACPGQILNPIVSFSLSPFAVEADSIRWSSNKPSTIISGADNDTLVAMPDTVNIYTAKVYYKGCMNKDQIQTVVMLPDSSLNARVENDRDKIFVGNEINLLANDITIDQTKYPVDWVNSYYWNASATNTWITTPDTLTPTARPGESLIYMVTDSALVVRAAVTDPRDIFFANCVLTDTLSVEVFPEFNPPGAFTPNGDGYNDVWNLPGVQGFTSISIQVFNRWGGLVWKSDKYEPWDGNNSKGKAVPSGTYYYIIKYGDDKGTNKLSGSVTILR
jgi:gliding motility-associated-like protein